jgi:hypothetical protein
MRIVKGYRSDPPMANVSEKRAHTKVTSENFEADC